MYSKLVTSILNNEFTDTHPTHEVEFESEIDSSVKEYTYPYQEVENVIIDEAQLRNTVFSNNNSLQVASNIFKDEFELQDLETGQSAYEENQEENESAEEIGWGDQEVFNDLMPEEKYQQLDEIEDEGSSLEHHIGQHENDPDLQGEVKNLFIVQKNIAASAKNTQQLAKSGLTANEVLKALAQHVDINAIRQLLELNNNSSDKKYLIADGEVVDAVFTEAIHQFQPHII